MNECEGDQACSVLKDSRFFKSRFSVMSDGLFQQICINYWMRDSSVIATNGPESILDWFFANVNTLNPELKKTFWKKHMTLSFLQMLQSIWPA
jgi:hypothetical protein